MQSNCFQLKSGILLWLEKSMLIIKAQKIDVLPCFGSGFRF